LTINDAGENAGKINNDFGGDKANLPVTNRKSHSVSVVDLLVNDTPPPDFRSRVVQI
jgi:hypothetical protein